MAHIPADARTGPWRKPPDPMEIVRRQDAERLAQMHAEMMRGPLTAEEILRRTALHDRGGR